MSHDQAYVLFFLLGAHLFIMLVLCMVLSLWLRRIWIRLDRIPKQQHP